MCILFRNLTSDNPNCRISRKHWNLVTSNMLYIFLPCFSLQVFTLLFFASICFPGSINSFGNLNDSSKRKWYLSIRSLADNAFFGGGGWISLPCLAYKEYNASQDKLFSHYASWLVNKATTGGLQIAAIFNSIVLLHLGLSTFETNKI